MTLPEITLVIGIDFKTVQQLEVSHRTWKKFQPQIYHWPWVVFYDGCCPAFTNHSLNDLVKRGVVPEQTRFVPWPDCLGLGKKETKYEHQRDRMLAGHVWVPALHVATPYYLKIDTDCLALGTSDNWPDPDWFKANENGATPSWICPKWNYTKGVRALERLENWGDSVPFIAGRPRLNIPQEHPEQLRVGHSRMCSWLSFYDTGFAKRVVSYLKTSGHNGTLPFPSQDTLHWYVAARCGDYTRIANMKKHRFNNFPKLANLIETAQSVMRGEEQEAITDG